MTTFNQFTNLYQLSKTLRFELRPQGKTLENIQKNRIIIHDADDKNKPLKGNDAKRAENYKYAKKVIDTMHRVFIETCFNNLGCFIDKDEIPIKTKLQSIICDIAESDDLDSYKKELSKTIKSLFDITANHWISQAIQDYPEIWKGNITELQNKLVNTENNQQKKKLNHTIKSIQRKLDKAGTSVKFAKQGIDALFSNKDTMQLLEWQIWKGNINISGENVGINDADENLPKAALMNIVRNFDNFHSYFSGFNENRANVYNYKDFIATSIIFRTFEQNLFFHLNNINAWNTTIRSLNKHHDLLKDKDFNFNEKINAISDFYNFNIKDFMNPESFVKFMSQSGINKYNRIIGGEPADAGKEKTQGLNEVINLTRQQVKGKRNQFSPLSQLYKQILSQSDGFFIDEFKNDKELCEAITEFHNHYFVEKNDNMTFFDHFSKELEETLIAAELEADKIFIAKDKLTKISVAITGSWHTITDWITGCLNDKEIKQLNKQKVFSIGQLRKYFSQNVEGVNFFDKLKRENNPELVIDHKKPLFTLLKSKTESLILEINDQWKHLDQNGVLQAQTIDKNSNNKVGDHGFEQIAAIKLFLDACINLRQFVALFGLPQKKRPDTIFGDWYRFIDAFTHDLEVFAIYNKCRNYIAKKPFSTEKLKLTFDKVTLLDGWGRNKESANLGTILKKDENFYLAIMSGKNTAVFDYHSKRPNKFLLL